jgi:hypothetical protein
MLALDQKEIKIQYFTEVDDCIMAVYNYVKNTGCKIKEFNSYYIKDRLIDNVFGFKSADGYKFIFLQNTSLMWKKELKDKLLKEKITVVDFCNKQLMAFL